MLRRPLPRHAPALGSDQELKPKETASFPVNTYLQ